MGLSRVVEIVEEAKRLEVKQNKPCAIISNASRENQSIIYTSLKDLIVDSKDAQKPAILVFGDVVGYFS